MRVVALLAGASFLVVGTAVGVRLLRLAFRTRSLPELLLGGGLCSLTFVTLPAIILALAVRVGGPELRIALFAAGLVPAAGLATCLNAFTALVFRPHSATAWCVVALAAVVSAAGAFGSVEARAAALDADRVVSAGQSALLIAPCLWGMLWTGAESLRYHRKLRRRLALGLADPVVCDRFRLWAIGNLGAVVGTAVMAASLFAGWRFVSHPVPQLALAGAGLSLSVAWFLAFLPPEAYLARLRAPRAKAPALG